MSITIRGMDDYHSFPEGFVARGHAYPGNMRTILERCTPSAGSSSGSRTWGRRLRITIFRNPC